VHVDFVGLAGCTAFDIGYNEVTSIGPPVMLGNKVNGF
jgi:hypothetical protein